MVWSPCVPGNKDVLEAERPLIILSSTASSPVTFNSMASGEWTIIIQGDNVDLAVQRSFMLNAGVPEKTVITVGSTKNGYP